MRDCILKYAICSIICYNIRLDSILLQSNVSCVELVGARGAGGVGRRSLPLGGSGECLHDSDKY